MRSHDLVDGEEVGGEAEPGDRVELVVEAVDDLAQPARGQAGVACGRSPPRSACAAGRRRPRSPPGRGRGSRAGARSRCRGRPAGRAGTGRRGRGWRASRPAASCSAARRARDLARDRVHRGRAREVALGAHPVEVARVERDEPAGGVEHVGRRRAPGVDVADGVREDGRHAGGAGELEHAGGVADARRTALRAVVAHDLDGQRPGGRAAAHRARTARATSGRRASTARPTSESGPSRTSEPRPGHRRAAPRVLGDGLQRRRPADPAPRAGGCRTPAGTAGPSPLPRAGPPPGPRRARAR